MEVAGCFTRAASSTSGRAQKQIPISYQLLADAELIHYDMGASEEDVEEAVRKAVDFSTTARR